jgi:hypothetical protein
VSLVVIGFCHQRRIHGGSFQPGGSEKELGRDAVRPGVPRGGEIGTGREDGGKSGRHVHASNRVFADEVVEGAPGLVLFETWVSTTESEIPQPQLVHNCLLVFTPG